jgi:hypothetical protein
MAVLGVIFIASILAICGNHKRKLKDAEKNNTLNMSGSTVASDKSEPGVYRGPPPVV